MRGGVEAQQERWVGRVLQADPRLDPDLGLRADNRDDLVLSKRLAERHRPRLVPQGLNMARQRRAGEAPGFTQKMSPAVTGWDAASALAVRSTVAVRRRAPQRG